MLTSRVRIWWVGMLAFGAVAVPSAQADVLHTVSPGESLSSIAGVDGLGVDALAAANGMSADEALIEGRTIVIPTYGDGGGSDQSTAPSDVPTASGGGYVVVPGDTLYGIAASYFLPPEELAAANGVSVDTPLYVGSTLTIPGAGGGGSTGSASTGGEPYPTPGAVTGDQIAGEAAGQNIGPNFGKAVAWQESGWENGLVSTSDARGVMQIIPSTWDFIQNDLAGGTLDPASPQDNVRAGMMYLGYLFDQNGNDPANTLGSYYQGLGAVQADGLYPETQQYVNSVLTLRDQFAAGG
jgi:LysM repeat protein